MGTKVILVAAAVALSRSFAESSAVVGGLQSIEGCIVEDHVNSSHACAVLAPSGPRQLCLDRFVTCLFSSLNRSSATGKPNLRTVCVRCARRLGIDEVAVSLCVLHAEDGLRTGLVSQEASHNMPCIVFEEGLLPN